jgi:hypothetical protein
MRNLSGDETRKLIFHFNEDGNINNLLKDLIKLRIPQSPTVVTISSKKKQKLIYKLNMLCQNNSIESAGALHSLYYVVNTHFVNGRDS